MGVSLPTYDLQRQPVRGVLLDVFGTLFAPAGLRAAFSACNLDPALIPLWLARIAADGTALAAAQDYRRFTDVALNALVELAPEHSGHREALSIVAAIKTLDPHPDVRAGLALLRAAGLRVMALCTLERALIEALFVRARLQSQIDGYLSVETVRRWKPAPEVYAYGVAQLGVPPAQAAIISVHACDIHGARRAGLQTGQIQREPTPPNRLFDQADVVGADLPEVVEKLLSVRTVRQRSAV